MNGASYCFKFLSHSLVGFLKSCQPLFCLRGLTLHSLLLLGSPGLRKQWSWVVGSLQDGLCLATPHRSLWSTGRHHVAFSYQMPTHLVVPPSLSHKCAASASLLLWEFSRWTKSPGIGANKCLWMLLVFP